MDIPCLSPPPYCDQLCPDHPRLASPSCTQDFSRLLWTSFFPLSMQNNSTCFHCMNLGRFLVHTDIMYPTKPSPSTSFKKILFSHFLFLRSEPMTTFYRMNIQESRRASQAALMLLSGWENSTNAFANECTSFVSPPPVNQLQEGPASHLGLFDTSKVLV